MGVGPELRPGQEKLGLGLGQISRKNEIGTGGMLSSVAVFYCANIDPYFAVVFWSVRRS